MVTASRTTIIGDTTGSRSVKIAPAWVSVVVAKPLSTVINVPKIGIN